MIDETDLLPKKREGDFGMRNITVAENAGFCFGVKRATDRLEQALQDADGGERIFTLGHLIHNETYNESLRRRGVESIEASDIQRIASEADAKNPVTVLVRAHGCPRETVALLERFGKENPHFKWLDCTCPYVKKIHKIAQEHSDEEHYFILIGAKDHPEVIGIMSCFDGEKYVFSSPEELEWALSQRQSDNMHKKTPVLVAQTTQNLVNWQKSQKKLKNLCTNAIIFDTICSVTETRQTEAETLARTCDFMVVIGGRESSNTAKLYEICRKNCDRTVWIANASELDLGMLSGAINVGIVAGASTPSDEIEEVYKTMSEMKENFEKMLEESECSTLNTGDVVIGTVTHVSDAELQLDVGVGVTGYIKADQITNDSDLKLTELFKNGESLGIYVSLEDAFAEMIDSTAEYEVKIGYYSFYVGAPEYTLDVTNLPRAAKISIDGVNQAADPGYLDKNTVVHLSGNLTLNSTLELSNVELEGEGTILLNKNDLVLRGDCVFLYAKIVGLTDGSVVRVLTDDSACFFAGVDVHHLIAEGRKIVFGADSHIIYLKGDQIYLSGSPKLQIDNRIK